jgi:hypothetical protein
MKKTDQLVQDLEEKLILFARQVIRRSSRLPPYYKERFMRDPDSYLEHKPKYHQWGIITHSKKFNEMHQAEARQLLQEWGLESRVDEYMEAQIDRIPKAELLKIAIVLHDIGKFDKTIVMTDGKPDFDYKGHERLSQIIILGEEVRGTLESYGLTRQQIEYIAECAGKHFELGLLRYKVKQSGKEYAISYSQTQEFRQHVREILPGCNGLAVEVGLLYLSDSLSKTDIRIPAKDDEERLKNRHLAELQIKERGLHPELISAALERPVSIAIAGEYLKMVLG